MVELGREVLETQGRLIIWARAEDVEVDPRSKKTRSRSRSRSKARDQSRDIQAPRKNMEVKAWNDKAV